MKSLSLDLSYSLNLELVKGGILNSLVPINLLESVLSGQIITQSSASNILKFQVPMSGQAYSESIDINCLLIRYSELEFDNPSLRNCRTQLRKYRTLLQKMVRQQHYWQNRLIAKKVHDQWMTSTPIINSSDHPKN